MSKVDGGDGFIPYDLPRLSKGEMIAKSKAFAEELQTRRSVRVFSQEPIPLEAVRHCIDAAGTAPSGAHKQPWTFVVVSSETYKAKIREAAEKEEYLNYNGRMSEIRIYNGVLSAADVQENFNATKTRYGY